MTDKMAELMTDHQAKTKTVVGLARAASKQEALAKHVIFIYGSLEKAAEASVPDLTSVARDFEGGFSAGIAFALGWVIPPQAGNRSI